VTDHHSRGPASRYVAVPVQSCYGQGMDLPTAAPRDVAITVKLSAQEYARLRALSVEQGVSMSHVLRAVLRPAKAAP